MKQQNTSLRILFILVVSMFCWGSAYPVSKYIMCNVHPAFMAFTRHFFGFLPLIPFYMVEKKRLARPIPWKDVAMMSFIGTFGIAGFALFLFYGVDLSSAATGSTLANTQPIFAVILSPLILRESLNRWEIIGAVTGLFGMVLVTTGGHFSTLALGEDFLLGNLLLLGASLSMTFYNITLKRYIRLYGGMIPTFFTMLSGSVVLMVTSLVLTDWHEQLCGFHGFTDLLLVFYLGFAATALPFFLFNYVLKYMDVLKAAGFKFLIPVTGVSLSMLLIGEKPGPWTLSGIGIVVVSVIILQRKPRKFSNTL